MVYTVRWGIMATGGIAEAFVKDLLQDGKTRGCPEIDHKVVAVASERGAAQAQAFVKKLGVPNDVACYGDYPSLVANKDVEIIYVATPHGRHYRDCVLALNANKHVLCEKAFTINRAQLEHLVHLAKQKDLFLMEAVWTRYFPLMIELQKLLHEDKILGRIRRVQCDLSNQLDEKALGLSHRLFDPEKGGSALLDLGIYSLTHVFVTCYQDPANERTAPEVSAKILKHPVTGVDVDCSIALAFQKTQVMATALTSFLVNEPGSHFCVIQGDKGDIYLHGRAYQPTSFTIKVQGQAPVYKEFTLPGRGMSMEADEAGLMLRDGKKESPRLPLEESLVIMGVMDEVRYSNGFRYADHIEAVEKY